MSYRFYCLFALCLWANGALVFANTNNPNPYWSGNAQLGYISTSGNTYSNTLSSALNLNQSWNNWENDYLFQGLFANNSANTTANRFAFIGDFRYKLKTADRFWFIRTSNIYDQFNIYDVSLSLSAGYARPLFMGKYITSNIQFGPGYRNTRIAGTLIYQQQAIAYTGLNTTWAIAPNATFAQNTDIEMGTNNTSTMMNFSLGTQIIGNINMNIAFAFTHNSEIPPQTTLTQKTDYRTTINLSYQF